MKTIEGGESMHLGCGNFEEARRETADYQEIGLLKAGRHRIVFDVSVDAFAGMAPSRLQSWSGPVAIDFEIVPSLEDSIPPVDSAELRDLVRRSLCRFPPSDAADDPPPSVVVAFVAEGGDAPKLAATAVSLTIALSRKNELVAFGSMRVTQAGGFRPCQTMKSRWIAQGVELGPLRPPSSKDSDPFADYEVRVRGVSKDVLRHWGATGWWNGTVSIPLSELPVHR